MRGLAYSKCSVNECTAATERDTETERPRLRQIHPERLVM